MSRSFDKVVSSEALRLQLQDHADARVVFTNGCFDLLHRGHVHYLEEARALGDLLVVGVNGDESVRRLKGSGRPLQRFEDRAAVLAGLASVDFVIRFDEDTPLELIRKIEPQVLVKGGDYTVDEVVGRDEVEAAGGRVQILPFLPGYSTTALERRIVERTSRPLGGTVE